MEEQPGESMKGQATALLGLLNMMIGGTILVLPVMGIASGYLMIPFTVAIVGFFSYYSCQLII